MRGARSAREYRSTTSLGPFRSQWTTAVGAQGAPRIPGMHGAGKQVAGVADDLLAPHAALTAAGHGDCPDHRDDQQRRGELKGEDALLEHLRADRFHAAVPAGHGSEARRFALSTT